MKYPIGIQEFEKIINGSYVYVDKTALIYRLVTEGSIYFLSRPRRFGKSLLVSTLECYFRGRKELFRGLAIDSLEKEWAQYPVFHIDFNGTNFTQGGALEGTIEKFLTDQEEIYGKNPNSKNIGNRFIDLLKAAHQQTGRRAVVLIDEYDKPILDVLDTTLTTEVDGERRPIEDVNREILKAFYSVFKAADEHLQFVLLTGVTKFSQVSVFSDLNQLNDISMSKNYATICGITKQELLEYFTPELEALAEENDLSFEETVETITRQYDGYHFHQKGEGVFNPFSVLNAFDKMEFGNYWFQTGTPTFLVELLKKSDYDLRTLMDGVEASAITFSEYRVDEDNPIPLIYQSGYLTIKDFDKEFKIYTLGFPNDEVRYGFLNFLVPFYTPVTDDKKNFYIGRFVQELRKGNVDSFMQRFEAFFADFPYELNDKTERHYQVVVYLIFKLMGEFTQAEVRSAKGRADAIVQTPDYVYIFEFKLNGTAEEALLQINEKGYAEPFKADKRKVVKVGVEFSAETRNVKRWLME